MLDGSVTLRVKLNTLVVARLSLIALKPESICVELLSMQVIIFGPAGLLQLEGRLGMIGGILQVMTNLVPRGIDPSGFSGLTPAKIVVDPTGVFGLNMIPQPSGSGVTVGVGLVEPVFVAEAEIDPVIVVVPVPVAEFEPVGVTAGVGVSVLVAVVVPVPVVELVPVLESEGV